MATNPDPNAVAPSSAPQQLPIPPEIQTYLENLIAEAKIPTADPKSKDDLVRYLFDKLDKFLAAKIVENMKPEDVDAFVKMNQDQKSREEIDAFIKEHMENPQEVFTRAFVDFRDFYLTGQSATPQQ